MTGSARALPAAAIAAMTAACSTQAPAPAAPPKLTIAAPSTGAVVRPGEQVPFQLRVDAPGEHVFTLSRVGAEDSPRTRNATGGTTITYTVPGNAAPGERLSFSAVARHARTNLSDREETYLVVAGLPPGGSPAPSPPTASAEQWEGTWVGRATGNIYDDEAKATFTFTAGTDRSLRGRGKATLATRPVAMAGCTYRHAQSPASFDVTITGRREVDGFALQITGPGMVGSRVVTAACAGGGGAGPAAQYDAFGTAGIHPPGLSPRVPARDGGTVTVSTQAAGGFKVEYTTTIRRAGASPVP